MEVTNKEIAGSIESLGILSSMRLPVLVGLQVAKLVIKLREPYEIAEKVRIGLIRSYGQQQESGETAVIMPNDPARRPLSPEWEKFVSELDELMAQVVILDVEKIQLPAKIDGKPLLIEPSILVALEKFIAITD